MYEVYTKEHCPNCVLVKEKLKSQNLEYKEIDITPDNLEDIISRSNSRSAPIVFKDGVFVPNNEIL